MRKILSVMLVVIMTLFIASCQDNKTYDHSINVLFYVGRNATPVESYDNLEKGSKIEAPTPPERLNFHFEGWYKDIDFDEEWNFAEDIVDKTMVLYAKWSYLEWNISFIINEEKSEEFLNINDVPEIIIPAINKQLPVVKRPGGIFKGWIVVPVENYTKDMKIFSSTNDLFQNYKAEEYVLYALFENIKTMVTFNKRNDDVLQPAPKPGVEYGSTIDWLPALEDTETMRFLGWFSKNGAVLDKETGLPTNDWGIEYKNGDSFLALSSVLTLYAKWEEK